MSIDAKKIIKQTQRYCFGLFIITWLIFATILPAFAQESGTNLINLNFPKVTKDGQAQDTRAVSANNWQFDGELNLDDQIRCAWKGADLDLKYRDKPVYGGGYLKVYLGDDSKPENFLLDYGACPLPVSAIAPKLKEGPVKLLFVYIDNTNKPALPSTRVVFSFNFKNATNKPSIKVVAPTTGTLFRNGTKEQFVLELSNFELESGNSGAPNKGKLNVYFNEAKPTNFLATISSSVAESGKSMVRFTNDSLGDGFTKIPDSLNTKLIFVLTRSNGDALAGGDAGVDVKTNYNNSINVGAPKISIIEPSKARSDLSVDSDQKFVVQIENFEVVSGLQNTNTTQNTFGKGYMQIIVNNTPIKTWFTETEFTLKDLGVSQTSDKITVKVQLVNLDYSKLSPEVYDSIDVTLKPATDAQVSKGIQNNNWRFIIIGLTVLLVVGGIGFLITKG